MAALFLQETDVVELIAMADALDVVEGAFRELHSGGATNVPRHRATAPGLILHTMSATAQYLDYVGLKAYTTTRAGARFFVLLFDGKTGELDAVIEADALGRIRTGAASGVATRYMARTDSSVVGLFGAGLQARSQLEAVCAVRKIEVVQVYSRNEERRERFCEEMSDVLDIDVEAVPTPDEAAVDKDIVICATNSKRPVFEGNVLDQGTHLNVIGSNFPTKAEIDFDCLRSADHIVCDSVEACREEAGDLIRGVTAGVTSWNGMRELGAVVAGTATGRARNQDITLFKSVGLAIQDVALAAAVLERAEEEGRGTELPF